MKGLAMQKSKQDGYMLIEVMIVVVLLGILTAIALPSYQEYMRRGRRAEARAGLLQAAQWLERVATAQGQYLSKLNDFPESLKTVPSNSYDISLASSNASAYTLQADPKNAQANDRCGGFTLTQSGERGLTSTSTNSIINPDHGMLDALSAPTVLLPKQPLHWPPSWPQSAS